MVTVLRKKLGHHVRKLISHVRDADLRDPDRVGRRDAISLAERPQGSKASEQPARYPPAASAWSPAQ